MHDIRLIRADGAAFDASLARRGLPPVAAAVLEKDTARRAAQTALQDMQAKRNTLSRQVGEGRRNKQDTSALEAEVASLRDEMDRLEQDSARLEAEIRALLE